jgi:alpha-amylase
MTRRREGYHDELRRAAEHGRLFLPGEEGIPRGVRVKQRDVHTRLFYDWHRRVALLDHFLHDDTTPESFYQARYGEEGDFIDQPYQAQVTEADGEVRLTLTRDGTVWAGEVPLPIHLEKRITVRAGTSQLAVRYRVINRNDIPADLRFGVEFNWGIVGGGSHYGYLKVGPKRRSLSDFAGDDDIASVSIGSTLPDLGGEVRVTASRPANLWQFPLEAISNSEAGYERVYQGTCTLLWWATPLQPRLPWDVHLTMDLLDA